MMTKKKHIRSLAVGSLMILALIVSACETPSTSNAPSELPEEISTTPPYTKVAPSETATATSTATPNPARTSTPTATATKIRTPTWTPLATLPAAEAAKFARELYINNAGCKLPCWWGATPGETPWNTTEQFVSVFVRVLRQGDITTTQIAGNEYTKTVFGAHLDIFGETQEGYVDYGVTNGTIDGILVSRPGTELSYQVQQVLQEYEEPGEMWLIVNPYHPLRVPIYNLILFYPDKGIMAEYEGEAIRQGSQYKICPAGVGPKLILYPPEKDLSVQSVYSYNSTFLSYVKPIEDATGLSIESIFSALSQQSAACIETPVNKWE